MLMMNYTDEKNTTYYNMILVRYYLPKNDNGTPLLNNNTFLHTMMTFSNGNIFRVTKPLCGEIIGHRWISLTKASVAELQTGE